MKAIAIIPARGGSKRLPRKNVMPFKGEPIIARPIRAAQAAGLDVYVSSEDAEILSIARQFGAVPVSRPDHLATDDASELHAYRHVLDEVPYRPDYFVALYPTAVFITAKDIAQALEQIDATGCDVVMGVTAFDGPHPYQMIVNEGAGWRLRVPGLNEMSPYPPAVASNGSMYVFRTDAFIKNPHYYPPKLGVSYTRSVDINTIEDFRKAEAISSVDDAMGCIDDALFAYINERYGDPLSEKCGKKSRESKSWELIKELIRKAEAME